MWHEPWKASRPPVRRSPSSPPAGGSRRRSSGSSSSRRRRPSRRAPQGGRNPWPLFAVAALVLLLIGVGAVVALGGGEDEAEAQTVRFQEPTDPGPAPFTKPTDRKGEDRVRVGSGPFGGTGSDHVCDRDLLISSLRARPDRMRAWARVLGIEPTTGAVTRYIRSLRPYTLTRDTRVTNHSFVDGRAVAFQSILQAGTAVLVDEDGTPSCAAAAATPCSSRSTSPRRSAWRARRGTRRRRRAATTPTATGAIRTRRPWSSTRGRAAGSSATRRDRSASSSDAASVTATATPRRNPAAATGPRARTSRPPAARSPTRTRSTRTASPRTRR